MAALLVIAGAMIHDRITEKKDAKRRKALDDERRHRQLQAETDRKAKTAGVSRNYDSEDEKEDEPLPRYEDVAGNEEGSSSTSATQTGNEAPPGYGSRLSAEPRRHPGVEFSPERL